MIEQTDQVNSSSATESARPADHTAEDTAGSPGRSEVAAMPGTRLLTAAVLFLILAHLLLGSVDAYLDHQERTRLRETIALQQAKLDEIEVVRRQLNAIAGKTLLLAKQGNSNALAIVEKLRAAGVNLSENKAE